MNPITRECDACPDLQEVLEDIDCTILFLTKHKYDSIVYGVKECFDPSLLKELEIYKRIITSRLYNPSYPCSEYTSNEILGKARLLAYRTNCSNCPECEAVDTTTTTLPPIGTNCSSYMVSVASPTGISTDYPYSYIDCEGNVITGTISQYQALTICAIQYTITISPIFTIDQYDEECDIVPEDCKCTLIKNEETESGVAPYAFSYSDCNGNDFVDIALDYQETMNICVRPSTLTTNFAFSLTGNTPCIEDCPTTTTTTLP